MEGCGCGILSVAQRRDGGRAFVLLPGDTRPPIEHVRRLIAALCATSHHLRRPLSACCLRLAQSGRLCEFSVLSTSLRSGVRCYARSRRNLNSLRPSSPCAWERTSNVDTARIDPPWRELFGFRRFLFRLRIDRQLTLFLVQAQVKPRSASTGLSTTRGMPGCNTVPSM